MFASGHCSCGFNKYVNCSVLGFSPCFWFFLVFGGEERKEKQKNEQRLMTVSVQLVSREREQAERERSGCRELTMCRLSFARAKERR